MREKRKQIAQETIAILQQGFYTAPSGECVDIRNMQNHTESGSHLITPEQSDQLVKSLSPPADAHVADYKVKNESIIKAIIDNANQGESIAALNFASAKNPGGGFLGGAMAQEEALAYSSGLYNTQIRHIAYYEKNRTCGTMTYTDYAIYSPDVPFFRDADFNLLEVPKTCSVLTLPAVNMDQVRKNGENAVKAKLIMKNRMRIALAIFAHEMNSTILLGAYGCGVFGNDPYDVAWWWNELLFDDKLSRFFKRVLFVVLDKPDGPNIKAFEAAFGK